MRTVGNPYAILNYAVALATGIYAIFYMLNYVVLPPHLAGGGHWQFLTNISLLVSQVVFALGASAHVLKSPKLFILKNNVHPIALAMEMIVTGIYWPLRIMFVHILVKDPSSKFVPLFVDFCLHLFPVICLAIDYFFFMPRWTVQPRFSFSICVVLAALYWWWLKIIIDFENGGEYPYMFLNVPDESTRALIFGVVALLAFGSFMFLRSLYDLFVHESEAVEAIEKKLQ